MLVLVYQPESVDHIAAVMVDVVLTRTLYFKILQLNQFFLNMVILIAHLCLYYMLFIIKQEKLAINII